ncbi:MAG: hypothetical protein AMXMBFR20_28770 [Planctomycetia bacterium]
MSALVAARSQPCKAGTEADAIHLGIEQHPSDSYEIYDVLPPGNLQFNGCDWTLVQQ